MKKVILFLCLPVILLGCASLTVSQVNSRNRENLTKLYVNLPRSNVLAIMGSSPVTLDYTDITGKVKKQVTIANPYRTEILQISDRKLEVISYVIDIKEDGTVNEDGLMPIVFENDKIIGWGKEFLQSMKKQ